MLDALDFLDDLTGMGLRNFFGVPDSLLSALTQGIEARAADGAFSLEITANEGAAMGLAIGSYLATAEPAAVFLQNSGLGNLVNPLTSLAHPKVYSTPMLLIVGWRGEILDGEQVKDEPQHVFQGEITLKMLDLLEVPYQVIGPDMTRARAAETAAWLLSSAKTASKPTALVIRKDSFFPAPKTEAPASAYPAREAAIAVALSAIGSDTPIVATTGKISREVYELRLRDSLPVPAFLTVGGMGHAAMIAAGLARERPGRKVACFDGDGAVLMHAGSLATAAKADNLIHLVLNNQVHDSVGGHATAGPDLHLDAVARAFGYKAAVRITELADIAPAIREAAAAPCACFLEIMVAPGARAGLGRPKDHPAQAKAAFMRALDGSDD
ncbi:MAG: phosphonopyruvate decarboxylase [Rhodobacter sp.]|nr:phosphonopyruvate decarboxylase [Rhodobacter sp.]